MSSPFRIVIEFNGPDAEKVKEEIELAVREQRDIPLEFILNEYGLEDFFVGVYQGNKTLGEHFPLND